MNTFRPDFWERVSGQSTKQAGPYRGRYFATWSQHGRDARTTSPTKRYHNAGDKTRTEMGNLITQIRIVFSIIDIRDK